MLRLSRPPPLRNLRAFCVAGRQHSFKSAADELCLTPSAVSHQIRELETLLGLKLFERRTRSVELTMAGRRLLEEAEPLLEALDRTLAQLARRHGRETLRVRLPGLFANELLIPRLGDFCAAHPHLDVQLDTRDPRPAAHSPTADVSIVITAAVPPGLRSARLFACPLIAVCAPKHAAYVARLGGGVFAALPLIVDRSRPFAWSGWAEEAGLATPEPQQVIELDTMIAVVRAAERGLGVALVPALLCDSWLGSGALVRVFAVEFSTSEAYYLVSRPRDSERAPVKALTEWVLSQFQRG
jgi:LysR family transcriptional regulator, glycine cleavage system transcriptional activator